VTRCPRHGLAIPPDGTCIVCRREARGGESAGLPAWPFALVGLVLAGLLVFGVARTVLQRAETATAEPPPSPLQRFAASPASSVPSTHEPSVAASAVPAWFTDEQARVPEERKRVSITVYSTSWCPSCRAAKAWLANHHQPYFERDIEQDPEANERMRKLNPAGGVPTINIEDDILIGFDGPALDRAIDGAARRHIASARVP
jgi:glutaredoxin 3